MKKWRYRSVSGDYPPNWPEVAKRIKDAAGWQCEHCNHVHEPATGYCLTVHHLDGNKGDCRYRNLVALCQRCHLHIQGTWIPGQQWLTSPPAWAIIRGWTDQSVYLDGSMVKIINCSVKGKRIEVQYRDGSTQWVRREAIQL